jgi:hypothetical protein
VRVVTRPLSFYTRWEFIWAYDWNVKAGEDIRILDLTDGADPELPAPPAVLAALPLGLLPRPPCLLSPDTLLRTRRPRVGAVHPQPALQLSQPQLEPPLTLPRRVKARPQRRDLPVPVRQQPRSRAFAARSPAASSAASSSGTRRRLPQPPLLIK